MNLLTLTLLFIIISTLITTFIRKTKKDRCLKDFINDNITIEIGGSIEKGVMKLESTGMELYYKEKKDTERGNKESSYILYRGDLERIDLFIRFLDDLSKENKENREKELKKFYHPSIIRRGWRKTLTFLKMIKDSVIEIVDLIIGHIKMTTSAKGVMTSQDKHISKVRYGIIESIIFSYEPLLENHIGQLVLLEMEKDGQRYEYSGVLKEYSDRYLEVLNVKYETSGKEKVADVIVSRRIGIVRHLGE